MKWIPGSRKGTEEPIDSRARRNNPIRKLFDICIPRTFPSSFSLPLFLDLVERLSTTSMVYVFIHVSSPCTRLLVWHKITLP